MGIDTAILLRAIAQELPTTYQPYGYPEPIAIAIKKAHPKSVAEFTDKKAVAVLTDTSATPPNGYDRLSRIELQLTVWAVDSENAQSASDTLSAAIQSIGCGLCMPGQGLAGNLTVSVVNGTSYSDNNSLYYRAIRFRGFVGTGNCGEKKW